MTEQTLPSTVIADTTEWKPFISVVQAAAAASWNPRMLNDQDLLNARTPKPFISVDGLIIGVRNHVLHFDLMVKSPVKVRDHLVAYQSLIARDTLAVYQRPIGWTLNFTPGVEGQGPILMAMTELAVVNKNGGDGYEDMAKRLLEWTQCEN